ncbi:hypothetical protein BJY52DRAFT_499935 [Lactarius psammicola]|nr:hypothetical protein BJY52DRAFT_499935 [Lactarius psammicola]
MSAERWTDKWRKYVSGNSYKSHFLAHAHSRSACFSCSLYHTSCEICTAPAALVVTHVIHYLRVLGGCTAISSLTKVRVVHMSVTNCVCTCQLSNISTVRPSPIARGLPHQFIARVCWIYLLVSSLYRHSPLPVPFLTWVANPNNWPFAYRSHNFSRRQSLLRCSPPSGVFHPIPAGCWLPDYLLPALRVASSRWCYYVRHAPWLRQVA